MALRRWTWIFLCIGLAAQAHATSNIDAAWREHDRDFAAQYWTDQGEAVRKAREKADAAARAGQLGEELRARADYISQVLPLSPENLALAQDALARAKASAQLATAFDLLWNIGYHTVLTHAAPLEPLLAELQAMADRLGDPARQGAIAQLQALSAIYTGRGADAVQLLTRALQDAPHDFRRVELLLSRVDAITMSTSGQGAAIDSARADLNLALRLVDPEKYPTFGFQAYSARGRLEQSAGQLDAAIDDFRRALRTMPPSIQGTREHSNLLSLLANALLAQSRFAEAKAALTGIPMMAGASPGDRMADALLQARIEAGLGGPDAASRVSRWLDRAAGELQALDNEPRLLVAYHRMAAEVYERTGQYLQAISAWKAADKAATERNARANERMRLEFQTKLDVATKERENSELRTRADLESERRLRWSWAFGISAVTVLVLAGAWTRSVRQKRRLAELRDELAHRNQQLEDRSSARIRMLAAACHDLRQPAHALGLLAELGVDAVRTPETSRIWLRNISRCSATLSEMLGELMDLSRLDGGHYRPLLDTVSLDELMHDLRLQYGETAHLKGLVFDAPPCGLHVCSDRQLVRRIVFNLVSNAVKYTRQGRISVTASVEQGAVALVVADTGPGIPADRVDEVFQDNVRLDPLKATDGLGIGLSIVKRAAHLLGHAVKLESTVGHGTRVTIGLGAPVEPSLAVDDVPEAATTAPPPAEGEPPRIIALIENDSTIREAMSAVLRRHGYSVVSAPSMQQLQAGCSIESLDLVITDMHLDTGDGLDAVAQLRQMTGRDALPGLLITGDLDAAVAQRAAAMQVQVQHKPLPPKRLLAAVAACLEAALAGSTTTPQRAPAAG